MLITIRYNKKKNGFPKAIFELCALKGKIKGLFNRLYHFQRVTTTCSAMIGHLFAVVFSSVAILNCQSITAEKRWKLLPLTLKALQVYSRAKQMIHNNT